MHHSVLVRMYDATKEVKNYPFDEGKREGGFPCIDERFHVTSVHRHNKTQVWASRTFSGSREFVQELRAMRRSRWS